MHLHPSFATLFPSKPFQAPPTKGGGAPTDAPSIGRISGCGSGLIGDRSPFGAPPRRLPRKLMPWLSPGRVSWDVRAAGVKIEAGWQTSLDTFFGSPDWRSIAYQEGADLFGVRRDKVEDAGQRILEWYRGHLRKAFGHVSTARLIKNTRGNPLYHLIWAGPNATGLKGAEYILSKGERVTARRSD